LQAFEGIPPLLPPGYTYTGEQHYRLGMIVRFSFKNTGDTKIILNNSAPWKIQSREGEIVFEPIALQAIVQLAPGEDKEWTWNQKDKDDRQVSEGGYMVVLECSEGEYGLRFWIMPEGMTP
jgi:plastocyanin